MPIPKTTKHDLINHLTELGLKKGDSVAVHSRLISFGIIEGGEQIVLEALTDVLGSNANIAVPTYTFNISSEEVYDPLMSKSYQVGTFSEFFRKLPGTVRSARPIHSHALRGPLATEFLKPDEFQSFGANSDFDFFLKHKFKLLLLGCKFSEGATYLHHLEAHIGVPYRHWINLVRKIRLNGNVQDITVPYFSRIEGQAFKEDFDKAMADIQKALNTAKCVLGKSYAIEIQALDDFVVKKLREDPYYLVGPNHP